MPIENLIIIGESINDSVPTTHELFETGNWEGILELARMQDAGGAAYIDVNVGMRSGEFMAEAVRRIQQVTRKPLAIDTPDLELARAGLQAYDPTKANGHWPILNSVSPLRTEMFDLWRIQPFRPILLISEHSVDGRAQPCRTAQETYQAAKFLLREALSRCPGLRNQDCIFDPGIAPIGSDVEGNLVRLIRAMEMIHQDPEFAGVHFSVGLSNFTVMLPSRRKDGTPVKSALESAFLTKAMPLGLDMIVGSVKRRYELLPPDHPAMQCLEDCLQRPGFEAILRVRQFYTE
ncbi:MAG: dihydropteroate synthase [Thermoguttaceae bacterium]|nr:dihydropteroate synthase [Thermoguttaceae bacterium]MDW8036968.1 dihydropteroate synthase [Thermoguttaceae bacterium]